MTSPHYSDALLRDVLRTNKTIAMVGVSKKTIRPSWFVGNYMSMRGYKVIPVNPVYEGETLFGEPVAPSLGAIPEQAGPIDMVDIFRRSDQVVPIVEEAISAFGNRGLKTIWMQIGVINRRGGGTGSVCRTDSDHEQVPENGIPAPDGGVVARGREHRHHFIAVVAASQNSRDGFQAGRRRRRMPWLHACEPEKPANGPVHALELRSDASRSYGLGSGHACTRWHEVAVCREAP